MTRMSHSSPYSSVFSLIGKCCAKALLVLAMVTTIASAAFAAPAATKTVLAISATSVPYQDPHHPDSDRNFRRLADHGGNCSLLRSDGNILRKQLRSGCRAADLSGATASVKLGSGPIGNHSYKAVFRANNTYASQSVEHSHLRGDRNLSLNHIVDLFRFYRQLHPRGNGRGTWFAHHWADRYHLVSGRQ